MFHTRTIHDVYSINMIVQQQHSLIIKPYETYVKKGGQIFSLMRLQTIVKT